jgi:hypothetical protein
MEINQTESTNELDAKPYRAWNDILSINIKAL